MASITVFAGSVPANYDQYLGPILFEPYALDLVDRLKNGKPQDLLELAAGTGRLTKHLADLIPPDGTLVATDLNPGMIELAQSKILHERIEWKVADAMNLPFDDNRFDHIVCQFGVMFFPDKEKSFREANRVLKPGGKYIFNVWERLEKNPRIDLMAKISYEVFKDKAPAFFQRGPYSFYDKNKIEQLLLNSGFHNISIDVVIKTSVYNSPDDLIKGFVDGSSLSNEVKERDEAEQIEFRKELYAALTEQEQTYGNEVPCEALVVEATK